VSRRVIEATAVDTLEAEPRSLSLKGKSDAQQVFAFKARR
jgi:hypothetical protein